MSNLNDSGASFCPVPEPLQKALECKVCLHTVKLPFKVCRKGHIVCSDCTNGLEKCQCEELFIPKNLQSGKILLEVRIQVCRYSGEGCSEIFISGGDHEDYCGYRPILCREQYCSVEVPLNKILDHYRTIHGRHSVKDALEYTNFWEPFDPSSSAIVYTPVFIFNNLFWTLLVNDVEKKRLKIYFEATPIGRLQEKYFALISIEKDFFKFKYSMLATEVKDCRAKLEAGQMRADEEMRLENQQVPLEVPHEFLHRFINENGELECDIVFFSGGPSGK